MVKSALSILFAALPICCQTIESIPSGYFISYSDNLSEWSIPINGNAVDYTKANEIVKANYNPLTVICSFKKGTVTKDADDLLSVDAIPAKIEVSQGAKFSIRRRKYFAVEGGGSFAFYIDISASGKYKYASELDLSDSDPSFCIKTTIDPRYLINLQEQLKKQNKRIVILFSKNLFAPGLLFRYSVKEAKEKADLKIISQEGEYICEAKENYSNRPVLRKFQDEKIVDKILKSPQIYMFVPGTAPETKSSSFDLPNNSGSFTYNGKWWQVSQEYMQHLKNENVFFKYDDSHSLGIQFPANDTLRIKSLISSSLNLGLGNLISLKEALMLNTTSDRINSKAILSSLDNTIEAKTYQAYLLKNDNQPGKNEEVMRLQF
jgi:hypothetical protein